ncbi:MAG: putative toxin-antitoxin system toxin component, PIN family [Acidobacteriaceae bacterium]
MVRVTADSNIYISALHFGGPPDDLLHLARAGSIQLSISDDIIDEVPRVPRDKFGWSKDALLLFRERVGDFTQRVTPKPHLRVVEEDSDDDRILECAVESKSEYLITGDSHLLRLGSYEGTRIIKVTEFLEAMRR